MDGLAELEARILGLDMTYLKPADVDEKIARSRRDLKPHINNDSLA